jgi:predicted ATPase
VNPSTLNLLSDRYRIEREIGRGGMATVYLAQDLKHQRQVAIKVMSPDIAALMGPDRFLREIEVAASLNHPHIVPLFDSGAAGELLYYVMPFVAGESLRARLAREQQLPVDEALRLAREVASALGYAHQHGLVHRDVKPENILLLEGMALVADFGIAHTLETDVLADRTRLTTAAGAVLGTPAYMSPEQARGGGVDARSDIYSLACVLFEMLAGQPPFVAPAADAVLRMHVTVEARPVTDLRPAVPGAVARVVGRALAKVPADRFATAAQFAEALDGATTSVLTPAALPGVLPPNNLPRPRTHFIGREHELAECIRLLADSRLLTLTGVGGGGKTRLAVRIAERTLHEYPDGVWLVDLGPLGDGERVADAVAAALGVRETSERTLVDSLGDAVRGRRMLVILDNCEHLLAAVADVADGLLESSDELRILVTSREGLGLDGERLVPIRPLAVPPAGSTGDLAAVAAADAVRLFVDRAQRVAREFALTPDNAEAVAEICRRLDGIPLAIELAAARVKLLSLDQIRRRLDDRFRLLTGGARTALPRHQTLLATLQWSYDHLPPEEQELLRTLSVFAGGWTLDAAARVLADAADEFQVLDLLSRLVDKSLVVVERDGRHDPRYRLLETVRQYATERLLDAGDDVAEIRRRHASAMLALAERAYRERIVRESTWSAALEAEHDNLRAALALVRDEDRERYLELGGALAWFWIARTHLHEGGAHLSAALDATSADPPRPARARALWGMANLRAWQGDPEASLRLMQEALRMWRALGDATETAFALEGVGWAQFLGGDDQRARDTFEECLRLHLASGEAHLANRARVALGQVLVSMARVEEARAMAADIIGFSQAHADRRSEHSGWHYLADCALIEGQCADSIDLYRQSLLLARETGDRLEMGFEIHGIAMSLSGLGDAERALRLAGAVEAEWARLGAGVQVRFWDALLERYLGQARRTLGSDAATRAWNEGRAMPYDTAIADALEASAATRAMPAPGEEPRV